MGFTNLHELRLSTGEVEILGADSSQGTNESGNQGMHFAPNSASYNAMMMGMTMPSQYNSITSKAPGIPASAQISTVIQFMGTGSPRNFAKARTMSPNIEFTTK